MAADVVHIPASSPEIESAISGLSAGRLRVGGPGDGGNRSKNYQAEYVQKGGLQIHKEIDIPKGNNAFLRTGIYDLKSNNAGTLGVPLKAVASPVNR